MPTGSSTPTLGLAVAGQYGDDDPRIQYSSGWSVWVGPGPEGGSAHRSDQKGAQLQFPFRGSKVGLVTAFGPDEGVVEVFVDGVYQPEAILYAEVMTWRQVVVYPVLPGDHLLTVRVSESRAMNSGGYDVVIDGFVVDPAPTPTATSTPTVTPLPSPTDSPTSTPTGTPVATPVTSTYIDGVVKLQARGDHSGVDVVVSLYRTTSAPTGAFALAVAPGVYQVSLSHRGYLTASHGEVAVGDGDSLTLPRLELLSGNLVDTEASADAVDEADLAFLVEHFGLRSPEDPDGHAAVADLTDDGLVDLYDLVALTSNWGKNGREHGWRLEQ